MNLSIGIVGLPNVGKSTLFNALLKKQQAFVANYPFATIEPNVGIVPVPDERLEILANIVVGAKYSKSDDGSWKLDLENGNLDNPEFKDSKSQNQENLTSNFKNSHPPIVPATVSFVDIAGLVKGAAAGEGLGNKFLSHIREVDLICHVVRYFKDLDVAHVSSNPNPDSDQTTINTELILADLQTLENQQEPKRNATKEEYLRWEAIKKLKDNLDKGVLAKDVSLPGEEKESILTLNLLTLKPVFIIANVSENDLKNQFPGSTIAVCAKTEAELSELSEDEQKEYLKSLGLEKSGLEKVIEKGYEMLGLISFLTAGEKEVRAWTIRLGSTSLVASGTIHTDFMKKFIKAEVVSFDDFVANGGWKGSRLNGKSRFEGRDYIVKDGDVVEFKIGS